jgi:hypothetical protein
MPTRATRVASLPDNAPPTSDEIEKRAHALLDGLLAFVQQALGPGKTFLDFERELVPLVFELARALIALFLCCRHEELDLPTSEVVDGKVFARSQVQDREISTFFGAVRYWRTYMRGDGGGFYPLDRLLKLPVEGFSVNLVSLVTRLATKMSYAQARLVVTCFLGWSPSTSTIEKAVLGLGKNTQAWFEQAPPPPHDGETLVIMLDSKATPTATEHELKKRRGKRRRQVGGRSPRHRGRSKRKNWQEKRRRKKGDRSKYGPKNGRAATLVVMYTLKEAKLPGGRQRLEGPLNRRVYASYAGKRHAFEVARRDATRRGFGPTSRKRVQLVFDGDPQLERLAREFFPKALITLDVIHAVEYLWKAGRSFYREGSKQLAAWVAEQKDRLYAGKVKAVVRDLRRALAAVAKTGPGNKGKRIRLKSAIDYLAKRTDIMNYDELLDLDLEISSGPVEGAVRYVIAQRFDAAGMRWITERSEALLQLRCIEINDQWDDFMRFVETRAGPRLALLATDPQPLPRLGSVKKSA